MRIIEMTSHPQQVEISRRDLKRIIKAGRRRQGLFNFDFGEPRWTQPIYLYGRQVETIPMWTNGTVEFHTRNGKMIERFLPWQPVMVDAQLES